MAKSRSKERHSRSCPNNADDPDEFPGISSACSVGPTVPWPNEKEKRRGTLPVLKSEGKRSKRIRRRPAPNQASASTQVATSTERAIAGERAFRERKNRHGRQTTRPDSVFFPSSETVVIEEIYLLPQSKGAKKEAGKERMFFQLAEDASDHWYGEDQRLHHCGKLIARRIFYGGADEEGEEEGESDARVDRKTTSTDDACKTANHHGMRRYGENEGIYDASQPHRDTHQRGHGSKHEIRRDERKNGHISGSSDTRRPHRNANCASGTASHQRGNPRKQHGIRRDERKGESELEARSDTERLYRQHLRNHNNTSDDFAGAGFSRRPSQNSSPKHQSVSRDTALKKRKGKTTAEHSPSGASGEEHRLSQENGIGKAAGQHRRRALVTRPLICLDQDGFSPKVFTHKGPVIKYVTEGGGGGKEKFQVLEKNFRHLPPRFNWGPPSNL